MTTTEPLARSTLKVGQNRGRPRIWIDGAKLHQAGFTGGADYWCCPGRGEITLRREGPEAGIPVPDGWQRRKVTGRPTGKPIVDIAGATVTDALGDAARVDVTFYPGVVSIQRSVQNTA